MLINVIFTAFIFIDYVIKIENIKLFGLFINDTDIHSICYSDN